MIKKKSQSQLDAEAEVYDAAEKQLLSEIDKVVKDMPSPSEVPYMLMATGEDFNGALINPLENASKYYKTLESTRWN